MFPAMLPPSRLTVPSSTCSVPWLVRARLVENVPDWTSSVPSRVRLPTALDWDITTLTLAEMAAVSPAPGTTPVELSVACQSAPVLKSAPEEGPTQVYAESSQRSSRASRQGRSDRRLGQRLVDVA